MIASARARLRVRWALFFSSNATFAVSGIGLEGFRAAPGRCQRAEGAGIALAAPVAEGGRVNTFAAQNGADAARFEGTISRGQDTQLVSGGERPPPGAAR